MNHDPRGVSAIWQCTEKILQIERTAFTRHEWSSHPIVRNEEWKNERNPSRRVHWLETEVAWNPTLPQPPDDLLLLCVAEGGRFFHNGAGQKCFLLHSEADILKTRILVWVPHPTFRRSTSHSKMSGPEISPHPTCEVKDSGDYECLHLISHLASGKWEVGLKQEFPFLKYLPQFDIPPHKTYGKERIRILILTSVINWRRIKKKQFS